MKFYIVQNRVKSFLKTTLKNKTQSVTFIKKWALSLGS